MARLLLVDDDPAQVKIWRLLLEASGHHIDTAGTVPQAIEQLSAAAPDVLLMDLRLPELKDGLALIRRAGEQQSLKILVLSGWPQDLDSRPEAKLVDRVIAKPVRPNMLLILIAELLAVAEPQR